MAEEKELEARVLQGYKRELSLLEVRYKVGELSLEEYRRASQQLQAKIKALEPGAEEVRRPARANRFGGIGGGREKAQAAARGLPSPGELARFTKRISTPRTRILAMAGGLLLVVSVFLPWIGPSEVLGPELGGDPGMTVSGIIGAVGVACGLIGVGSGFLVSRKAGGLVQMVMGAVALVAVPAIMLGGDLPLQSDYFRTLVVIREGVYVYVIAAAALVLAGVLERKDRLSVEAYPTAAQTAHAQ